MLSKLRQGDCLYAERDFMFGSRPINILLATTAAAGEARYNQPLEMGLLDPSRKGQSFWALMVHGLQVKQMLGTIVEVENTANGVFPTGVDTHWITENHILWNEKHRSAEPCELVYEVSWIQEIGAWRSFLRSQRFVESGR